MILLALLLGMAAPALTHTTQSPSPEQRSSVRPYSLDEILEAIRTVETGGEKDGGRHATGDNGRAIGPYQIHKEHWLDAGLPGRYKDCRDPVYARREVVAYWQRWCPKALERCDAEVLARVHNGGPKGCSKASTLTYWRKTRARLEEARVRAQHRSAEAERRLLVARGLGG